MILDAIRRFLGQADTPTQAPSQGSSADPVHVAACARHGPRAGRIAVLLLIGCLGLLIRAHEMCTDLAGLAGVSIGVAGLALAARRPWVGGPLFGAGLGAAFLGDGLIPALLVALLSAFSLAPSGFAQGTVITYQGRLDAQGIPASGIHQFTFSLHNAASGGSQIGFSQTNSVALSNGLFTVALDFGPQFNGPVRAGVADLEAYATRDREISWQVGRLPRSRGRDRRSVSLAGERRSAGVRQPPVLGNQGPVPRTSSQ